MPKTEAHDYVQEARAAVVDAWYDEDEDTTTVMQPELTEDDLFVVWFSFVLGNWKALVSTNRYNGLYWEVTTNSKTGESYVDFYRKTHQVILEDD